MNQSFLSIISRLLFGNKIYVAKYEINFMIELSVTGNLIFVVCLRPIRAGGVAVPDNCVVITVCRDEWPQLHSVMRGFRAGAAQLQRSHKCHLKLIIPPHVIRGHL